MLHRILMVLMIWGLISQPLAAAIPDLMPADISSSSLNVDSDSAKADHHVMIVNDASTPPCHESAVESSVTFECPYCDDGCASGQCASSCSVSSPAAISQVAPKLAFHSADRPVESISVLAQGHLTSIFHPPKRA